MRRSASGSVTWILRLVFEDLFDFFSRRLYRTRLLYVFVLAIFAIVCFFDGISLARTGGVFL